MVTKAVWDNGKWVYTDDGKSLCEAICTYNNFCIITHFNKLYLLDFEDMEVKQVELVAAIPITTQTDSELEDNDSISSYDISGELDAEPTYCYWKIVDER